MTMRSAPSPTNADRPRAFTLLEVLVVITILATAVMIVMPTMTNDTRLRLMAASTILTSDIELAQVMTIARPDEAVVVRFDAAGDRYWLAPAADPETPIDRADNGDPYVVVLGAGRASAATNVTFTLQDVTDGTLAFDAHGGILDFTAEPLITLGLDGEWIRLDVSASTGSVRETYGP
jgi:prepilin-type N-terminal cleavage/methylation domain-containing protein